MSIFSGIKNIEHTFANWAEKELSKLYNATPKIEQIADTILTYAGPALQTVVTIEAGATAGSIVGKAIQKAQSDLTAASGVIYDFGASPSTTSVIESVKTNLAALLSAGHVTNPTSIANINQVINELDILVTAFEKISTHPPTPAATTVTSTDPASAPESASTAAPAKAGNQGTSAATATAAR